MHATKLRCSTKALPALATVLTVSVRTSGAVGGESSIFTQTAPGTTVGARARGTSGSGVTFGALAGALEATTEPGVTFGALAGALEAATTEPGVTSGALEAGALKARGTSEPVVTSGALVGALEALPWEPKASSAAERAPSEVGS